MIDARLMAGAVLPEKCRHVRRRADMARSGSIAHPKAYTQRGYVKFSHFRLSTKVR